MPSSKPWYDKARADKAVRFFNERIHFTTGQYARKNFILEPWEEHDIIRPFFGTLYEDENGNIVRWYRRIILWVPRKNGKTELMAGVSILVLWGDAEYGAEGYCIASNENQAKIVFNKASIMVGFDSVLSDKLECFKKSIYLPQTNGFLQPLSGVATGKHGLNMSFLAGDEIHEWSSDDLYEFVHQSSASRLQPVEFLASTAGNIGSYGHSFYEECKKIKSGVLKSPRDLIVIYEADPKDDWTDPKTWEKANPNYGVSLSKSYLEDEFQKALNNPRKENKFKKYHLNIWGSSSVNWINYQVWSDNCKSKKAWKTLPKKLAGRKCWVGVDLGKTDDLTSAVFIFPPEPGAKNKKWYLLSLFWCPQEGITRRSENDGVTYDLWKKEGALNSTPGAATDYDVVEKDFRKFCKDHNFDVQGIGFDRHMAMTIAMNLQDEFDVGFVGQGSATMTVPMKEVEALLGKGLIYHGNHPLMNWCATNVCVYENTAGGMMPDKKRSKEKIDGISAFMTAIAVYMSPPEEEDQQEENKKSYFERLKKQHEKANS